ncbi:hypothetical protein HPB51_016594 [Rhipicephalus microplus]|uniref:Tick transposon n=1 Tax=Rhipicephalus microplus TaxID=6941 RepID=A0A9J6E1M6_RHIMP|nr:hypothetical protein HPB51_016594 [Rhipicephalus microplus]
MEQDQLSFPLQNVFTTTTCKVGGHLKRRCTTADEPIFSPVGKWQLAKQGPGSRSKGTPDKILGDTRGSVQVEENISEHHGRVPTVSLTDPFIKAKPFVDVEARLRRKCPGSRGVWTATKVVGEAADDEADALSLEAMAGSWRMRPLRSCVVRTGIVPPPPNMLPSRWPERKVRITDWDKFRELRIASLEVDGYDDWLAALTANLDATTQSITTTLILPAVDFHPLYVWDARRGLTKRWKRQHLSRKLKLWVTRVERQAQEYVQTLTRNNWRGYCNRMADALSTAKTWNILRALTDPLGTKTQTQKWFDVLAHLFRNSTDRLLHELKADYIPYGASAA